MPVFDARGRNAYAKHQHRKEIRQCKVTLSQIPQSPEFLALTVGSLVECAEW